MTDTTLAGVATYAIIIPINPLVPAAPALPPNRSCMKFGTVCVLGGTSGLIGASIAAGLKTSIVAAPLFVVTPFLLATGLGIVVYNYNPDHPPQNPGCLERIGNAMGRALFKIFPCACDL